MRAHVGDWLTFPVDGHTRRGRVVAVLHTDGSPPYRVRWLDDDHESVFVPPPDAVLSSPTPARASAGRKG